MTEKAIIKVSKLIQALKDLHVTLCTLRERFSNFLKLNVCIYLHLWFAIEDPSMFL